MPPTVSEIACFFGFSTATAFSHLLALQRRRLINRTSKALSIVLDDPPSPAQHDRAICVPLLSNIVAGAAPLAEHHIGCTLKIDPLFSGGIAGHRLFGLRIHGESMSGHGFQHRDIVIAREQDVADTGQAVIALVGARRL